MTTISEEEYDLFRGLGFGEWESISIVVDPPDRTFPNNAPLYDFKCTVCGLYCESHVRETTIWNCPRCFVVSEEFSPLRKIIRHSPAIARVWHGHQDLTTGKWITDRKQFREELHVASEQATERLGVEHRFIEVDPNDRKHLNVTEEGMDSTHNAHVALGIKESRGRFVFPMSKGKN